MIRRKLAALAVAAALGVAACGTTPKVITKTVVAPCVVVLPEDRTFPFDALVGGEDIHKQITTLLADRRERIADRRLTRAAAGACTYVQDQS